MITYIYTELTKNFKKFGTKYALCQGPEDHDYKDGHVGNHEIRNYNEEFNEYKDRNSVNTIQLDVKKITDEEWRNIERDVSFWIHNSNYNLSIDERQPFYRVAKLSLTAGIFAGVMMNIFLKRFVLRKLMHDINYFSRFNIFKNKAGSSNSASPFSFSSLKNASESLKNTTENTVTEKISINNDTTNINISNDQRQQIIKSFPSILISFFVGITTSQIFLYFLRRRCYEEIIMLDTPLGFTARSALQNSRNRRIDYSDSTLYGNNYYPPNHFGLPNSNHPSMPPLSPHNYSDMPNYQRGYYSPINYPTNSIPTNPINHDHDKITVSAPSYNQLYYPVRDYTRNNIPPTPVNHDFGGNDEILINETDDSFKKVSHDNSATSSYSSREPTLQNNSESQQQKKYRSWDDIRKDAK